MATASYGAVVEYLRRIAAPRPVQDLTDEQLLERFVSQRDEAAFALLVRRHGPVVLGVCRRLLHHEQDAEDAFQATFLVLVRRAGAIGKRQSVRSWLYGVAWRVAARARTERRRWSTQAPLDDLAAAKEAPPDDVAAVLDEEVNRLPTRYRETFLLCCLEGQTLAETARRLACPLGTIAARLHRARQRLRRRLALRGLQISGAGLMVLLADASATAAVSTDLVARTCSVAVIWWMGETSTPFIPARTLALTRGALRTMALTKTLLAGAVLVIFVLSGGFVLWLAAMPLAGATPPKSVVGFRPLKQAADAAKGPRWKERATLTGHKDDVLSLAVGPDFVVSGTKDKNLKLWSLETGKELSNFPSSIDDHTIDSLTVLPDGKHLAVCSRPIGGVTMIRLEGTKFGASPGFGLGGLKALGIAPDGKTWVFDREQHVHLLEVDFQVYFNNPNDAISPRGRGDFKGHTGEILAASFSNDGGSLATASADTTIRIWDVAGQKEQATCTGHSAAVNGVAFAPDGKTLISAGQDSTVRIWDAATGKEIALLKGHTGPVRAVACAPDGKTLASGGDDQRVLLWDPASGQQVSELKGHTGPVFAVAFSRDGAVLASGGQDKTVKLWEIAKQAANRVADSVLSSFSSRFIQTVTKWRKALGVEATTLGTSELRRRQADAGATSWITLYYDIELREPLEENTASGGMFPSTTLVTKNRIYVPVPPLLHSAFKIVEGAKEFYVRFDTIVNTDP